MAGTDKTRPAKRNGGPAIILVDPQLAENIGTVARAMYNFGLTDLRLVRPRDGWPNPAAEAPASGADVVLEGARVFDTTQEATAELKYLFAMTARQRDLVKPVTSPEKAAGELHAALSQGHACGVLFGGERAGLNTDDVVLADKIISVPVNRAFSSLNLAQAVLLVAYELFLLGVVPEGEGPPPGHTGPASRGDLLGMFEHLEAELDARSFFRPPERRPSMVKNLRTMLLRAQLTDQDVRTLRGVIKTLGKPPGKA